MNGGGFGRVLVSEWIHGIILLFSLLFVFLGDFFGSKRRPFLGAQNTPLAIHFGLNIEGSFNTSQSGVVPLWLWKTKTILHSFSTSVHFFISFSPPDRVSLCLNCVSSLFYSCEWANCPFENMLARNAHPIPIHLDHVPKNPKKKQAKKYENSVFSGPALDQFSSRPLSSRAESRFPDFLTRTFYLVTRNCTRTTAISLSR